MSIEAMKQALEALEDIWGCLPTKKAWPQDQVDEAIQTLRQALAQPEHEPVAWVVFDHKNNDIVWAEEGKKLKPETPLYTAPPNQEWGNVTDDALIEEVRRRGFTIRDAQISPKRWVGLTNDEIDDLWKTEYFNLHYELARAIEAKLKEKNT
jgi:hypothetical protein